MSVTTKWGSREAREARDYTGFKQTSSAQSPCRRRERRRHPAHTMRHARLPSVYTYAPVYRCVLYTISRDSAYLHPARGVIFPGSVRQRDERDA